ncbi:MAG: hypothetical protein ACI4I4_05455 [Acutalibacteraceae bacterium]
MENISSADIKSYLPKLYSAVNSGRLSHSVALESSDKSLLKLAVNYLCMYAVCKEDNRPCMRCRGCQNALQHNHGDVYFAEKSGKKEIINIAEIRKICIDAYIKPNEAKNKAYVLENADKMQSEAQNAFLKMLEEPPQNILFILTCESYEGLLPTIRSRTTVFHIGKEDTSGQNEQAFELALATAGAICEKTEYPLLAVTGKYSDRALAEKALVCLAEITGEALRYGITGAKNASEAAQRLSLGVKRQGLINIVKITQDAREMLSFNANANLFCTWLCSSLRQQKYI